MANALNNNFQLIFLDWELLLGAVLIGHHGPNHFIQRRR